MPPKGVHLGSPLPATPQPIPGVSPTGSRNIDASYREATKICSCCSSSVFFSFLTLARRDPVVVMPDELFDADRKWGRSGRPITESAPSSWAGMWVNVVGACDFGRIYAVFTPSARGLGSGGWRGLGWTPPTLPAATELPAPTVGTRPRRVESLCQAKNSA